MNLVVLLIVVYVFFVVIGGLRKMGRGTGAPPPRGRFPGQRPMPLPPSPRSGRELPGERRPGSAADMVPQDLWELLTGQVARGRQPAPDPAAPPAPAPRAATTPYDYDDQAIAAARAGAYDEETGPRRDLSTVANASLDEIRREHAAGRSSGGPQSVGWAPAPASDRPVPDRSGAPAAAGTAEAEASRAEAARGGRRPGQRAALRRAILAREILGPPKGLEGLPPRR